ncbi:spartin [Anaeramoeba flamelloides]|uniref:Spartin n=1 Tax=Anaeramoeba flamelloides TaxID=1746091 RepID=A0ABQ8YJM0_9EUKA|nr:spartin [Anaeramoeba flamelloides]
MIWGARAHGLQTDLITINGNVNTECIINDIFKKSNVIQLVNSEYGELKWIFQKDGACPHTSKKTQTYLNQKNPKNLISLPDTIVFNITNSQPKKILCRGVARISLTADEMILCSIEDFSIKIKEKKKVYQVDKLHYVVPENDFFFGFAISKSNEKKTIKLENILYKYSNFAKVNLSTKTILKEERKDDEEQKQKEGKMARMGIWNGRVDEGEKGCEKGEEKTSGRVNEKVTNEKKISEETKKSFQLAKESSQKVVIETKKLVQETFDFSQDCFDDLVSIYSSVQKNEEKTQNKPKKKKNSNFKKVTNSSINAVTSILEGVIDASNILVGSTLETAGCIFEKKYGKGVGDVAKNVTSSVKNLYKAKNEIKKIKTSSIQKIIKKKSKTVVKNNLNETQNTNNEIKKNVNVNEIKQDGRGEMEKNNKQNQNERRDENQNIIINESGNKNENENENENENKESKK